MKTRDNMGDLIICMVVSTSGAQLTQKINCLLPMIGGMDVVISMSGECRVNDILISLTVFWLNHIIVLEIV
jgi:hypothetical protein